MMFLLCFQLQACIFGWMLGQYLGLGEVLEVLGRAEFGEGKVLSGDAMLWSSPDEADIYCRRTDLCGLEISYFQENSRQGTTLRLVILIEE